MARLRNTPLVAVLLLVFGLVGMSLVPALFETAAPESEPPPKSSPTPAASAAAGAPGVTPPVVTPRAAKRESDSNGLPILCGRHFIDPWDGAILGTIEEAEPHWMPAREPGLHPVFRYTERPLLVNVRSRVVAAADTLRIEREIIRPEMAGTWWRVEPALGATVHWKPAPLTLPSTSRFPPATPTRQLGAFTLEDQVVILLWASMWDSGVEVHGYDRQTATLLWSTFCKDWEIGNDRYRHVVYAVERQGELIVVSQGNHGQFFEALDPSTGQQLRRVVLDPASR